MYALLNRFVVESAPELTALLEPTESYVWLSKTQRLQKYSIKGVPLNKIDVLWDGTTEQCWCEVGRISGQYDKHVKDRITLRAIPTVGSGNKAKCFSAKNQQEEAQGKLKVEVKEVVNTNDRKLVVKLFTVEDVLAWEGGYHLLRVGTNSETPAKILMWHYGKWFRHLAVEHHQEVVLVADSWVPVSDSLASQNREAERVLYNLSTSLGFVKLPKKVRDRLGIDPLHTKQWYTQTQVDMMRLDPARVGEILGISSHSKNE